MDQMNEIKKIVMSVLKDDIQLYDVSWRREGEQRILQISIMHQDGSMDIDTCAMVSEAISEKLDALDCITSEYFLEVCSPGAERILKDEQQIKDAIGSYVYVKLLNPKAGMADVKGTLLDYKEHVLFIQYMDKAVKKKTEIAMENVAHIRLSVKI